VVRVGTVVQRQLDAGVAQRRCDYGLHNNANGEEMKAVLVLLIIALLAWGFICTENQGPLQPHSNAKADYVRDQAHHCKEHSVDFLKTNDRYLNDDGTIKTVYGWRHWDCDNDISVIINNDEEQP
jgi:hypothetical protein